MKRSTKRKIKKAFNKNPLILFGICIIPVFILMSTGYSLLKQELQINGSSSIEKGTGGEKDPEDMSEICTAGISFSKITSWGSDRYQYNLVVTNNSSEPYYSWQLKFPTADISISSGSVTISQTENATYISNLSHNNELDPGVSTEELFLDITYNGDIEALFDQAIITACGRASGEKQVITDGVVSMTLEQLEIPLDVAVTLSQDWGENKLYTVVINNNNEVGTSGFRVILYYGLGKKVLNTYSWTADTTTRASEGILTANNGWAQQGEIEPGKSSEIFYLQVQCLKDDPNYASCVSDNSFIPNVVAAGVKKIS